MLSSDLLRPSRPGMAPASHTAVEQGWHDDQCPVSPGTLVKDWPVSCCCCCSTAANVTLNHSYLQWTQTPSLSIFPGSYNQLNKGGKQKSEDSPWSETEKGLPASGCLYQELASGAEHFSHEECLPLHRPSGCQSHQAGPTA